MNKTDRMLAIVLELQRKGVRRAEDLAAFFETSVRTIYRDMQALSEAGVPIVGAPGQGYSLMEGYFLPPVRFSVQEAVTLLLGGELVKQRFDAEYGRHAEASGSKIEALLPGPVREEVERVRSSMVMLEVGPGRSTPEEGELLKLLRRAILEERKVTFRYSGGNPAWESVPETTRTVAPFRLVWTNGLWMLAAFCELRGERRNFRLSRIRELVVEEARYPSALAHQFQTEERRENRSVEVHVRLDRRLTEREREARTYFWERTEEDAEGLLVTLRVRRVEEALPWLLSWGCSAKVLEPEELRLRMREEIYRMLGSY